MPDLVLGACFDVLSQVARGQRLEDRHHPDQRCGNRAGELPAECKGHCQTRQRSHGHQHRSSGSQARAVPHPGFGRRQHVVAHLVEGVLHRGNRIQSIALIQDLRRIFVFSRHRQSNHAIEVDLVLLPVRAELLKMPVGIGGVDGLLELFRLSGQLGIETVDLGGILLLVGVENDVPRSEPQSLQRCRHADQLALGHSRFLIQLEIGVGQRALTENPRHSDHGRDQRQHCKSADQLGSYFDIAQHD